MVKLRVYNNLTNVTVKNRTFKQQYRSQLFRGISEYQVTRMRATLYNSRNKVAGHQDTKSKAIPVHAMNGHVGSRNVAPFIVNLLHYMEING